ncbi:MAG: terminase small subunit [Acidobacteriota bacterium]|nr:terminase small subunit [Acidobacteriota bacterium]
MATNKLTLKEQKFLDLLFTSAKGNATLAAHGAGYGSTMPSAGVLGYRLLRKVKIQRALVARQHRQIKASILTAERRDELLSAIAQRGEDSARIRAIAELNKCSGRHSIKHVTDVTETLADIIAGSRE